MNTEAPIEARGSGGRWALAGLAAMLVVFAVQAWPHWVAQGWLAGTHADGPFHFVCQLSRLEPELFPKDLAVQSNQQLGPYETTYRAVGLLARRLGWPLLETNLAVCWLGNLLYLAGVLALLKGLGVPPGWGALGTLIAAQPYVLISMSSGVVHSLAIPREFWLWPLPWMVRWFAHGRREGWRLVAFYAVLGVIYGPTYPLWAALFGLAFGLADGWRFGRDRQWVQVGWLAAAGALCLALVVVPALGVANAAAGAESAVLDYNQITRSVYFTKGFRRLALFAAIGLVAFRVVVGSGARGSEAWGRLRTLLVAALAVCVVYEPFQRLLPALSLLYLGRLSLLAYLLCMVAVAAWLHRSWPAWKPSARVVATIGLLYLCLDPLRSMMREWRRPPPPLQPDFVAICRDASQQVPVDGLGLVPPDAGTHYFRVYAQRGLWIHGKDRGVLSRTRALYAEAARRLERADAFYERGTSPAEREALLGTMQTDGLTYVITRADESWSAAVSWPVRASRGPWQLRTPAAPP